MTETMATHPSYDEVVNHFSWETVLDYFDWPAHEKFNFAHEICDRWANDPAKAEQVALYYETKDGKRGSYTYRQLRDLSNRFANVLLDLSVKPGIELGDCCLRFQQFYRRSWASGSWVQSTFPCLPAFAAPTVAYRLRQGEVSVVVTDEANLPKIQQGQQSDEGLPQLKQVLVVTRDESRRLAFERRSGTTG